MFLSCLFRLSLNRQANHKNVKERGQQRYQDYPALILFLGYHQMSTDQGFFCFFGVGHA